VRITRLAVLALLVGSCLPSSKVSPSPTTVPITSSAGTNASPVVNPADDTSVRLSLPGSVLTWAAEGELIAYVLETHPDRALVYDLRSRSEREVTRAPGGWTIRQLALADGRLAYVRSASPMGPGDNYDVGFVDLASSRDSVVATANGAVEPNGGLIAPVVALNDALMAWSEVSTINDAEVRSQVHLRSFVAGSTTISWPTSQVAFVRAVIGQAAVVWLRPLGSHQSPTALRTIVVDTSASTRELSSGAANVEGEEQRVAIETLDGFAEVRSGLFASASERFPLEPPGVPALGRDFTTWCTEMGDLIVRHSVSGRVERRSAPNCSLTVRASGTDVFWLQADSGRAAIFRVRITP
jgi:hypothetical protein